MPDSEDRLEEPKIKNAGRFQSSGARAAYCLNQTRAPCRVAIEEDRHDRELPECRTVATIVSSEQISNEPLGIWQPRRIVREHPGPES